MSAIQPTEVEKAADLERQIDQQALILHTAEKREDRVAAMNELARLHALRSPEVVEEMEYERGLR